MFSKIRQKYYIWKVRRSAKMLREFDKIMSLAGMKRTEKRQIWRDFVKHSDMREEVLNYLVTGQKPKL